MKKIKQCEGKMHKLIICTGLIVAALFLNAGNLPAAAASPDSKQTAKSAPADSKVTAYYFHGKFRCVTCKKIEQYSREAMETYFAPQIRDKRFEFRPVNVEQKGNEHFIRDYQLYTRSLVLVLFRNGQQVKWKNLEGVWQHAGNREKFNQYVKSEVEEYLKQDK